jgi:biotin carboxyl carrier protein
MEKKPEKETGHSAKRKATTKGQVPVSGKVSSKKKEKLYTVLLPGIKNVPGDNYKVSVVDAKVGQPIAPHSDLGEMKVILKPKSKRASVDTVIIKSKEYGMIKEIYLKKGDIVIKGQPFALVELFDKDEFPNDPMTMSPRWIHVLI